MKKVISLLLVCMMMLAMVTAVSAADKVTVTVADVDATECATSDNIVIPVMIDKVPEGQARIFSFIISYDPTKVKFVQSYFYEDETEGVMAMPAYKPASGKVNLYPIEPTVTGATTANAQGWLKVEYSDSGTNVISAESIEKTNVFTYLWFTKVEGAKGTADLTITDVEIVDQATDSAGVAYTLSTTPDYIGLEHGSVKLSEVYSATVGENDTTKGNVAITAVETDGTEADPAELDGDLTETVTVTISGVVDGYKATPTATGATLVDADVDADTGAGTYTFTMPANNVTVDVAYTARTYTITYPDSVDGIKEWTSDSTAAYGSTVEIAAEMESGQYSITSLTYTPDGGEATDITSTKSFTMPAANVEIAATTKFSANAVAISAAPVDSTIVAADAYTTTLPTNADEKETVTFEVYQKAGYNVVSVSSDETSVSLIEEVDEYTKKYSFTVAEGSKDIVIDIDVEKIVYQITDGSSSLINSDALTQTLGANVDFASYQTTASVGDKVKFKVQPASGRSIMGVRATFSDGSFVNCTKEESILFDIGGVYSFTYPADGIVVLSATDASSDVSLESVKITSTYVDENNNDATEENSIDLVDGQVYYEKRLSNPIKDNTTVSVVGTVSGTKSVSNPVAVTINPNNTVEFVVTVTAEDGTSQSYTFAVTNPMASGEYAVEVKGNKSVTKGSKYEAVVNVTGLTGKETAVEFDVTLDPASITNFDTDVEIRYGSAIAQNVATSVIDYDHTTGVLSVAIENGATYFSHTDGVAEIITIAFVVPEDTSATAMTLTPSVGKLGLMDDSSGNAVVAKGYNAVEVAIVEEGASQADVYTALALGLYQEEDYTEQDWFSVRAAIKKAVEAIENAANATGTGDAAADAETATAAMEAAIKTLKATVGNYTDGDGNYVEPVIQTLEQFKDEVKTLVTDKAAEFNASNTYDTSATEIQDIVDKYNEDTTGLIDANTSRDEELLKLLVADAAAEMDAVETMEEYKAEAVSGIEAVDTSIYTDESVLDIENAETTAKVAIAAATTKTAVDKAVETFEEAIAKATLITTDRETSVGEIADYVGTLSSDKYSASNWNRILIEQIRGELKIADETSEAAMDNIVADTIAAIDAILTLAEEANEALKEINAADEISDIDLDLIKATGVENVDSAKEELYKAAIWEATAAGKTDIADVPALQTIINDANALTINLRGDFNCSGTVDVNDATGAMAYLCAIKLSWTPKAQGIVNADLASPGDGVLTVYDVVQILKEIK